MSQRLAFTIVDPPASEPAAEPLVLGRAVGSYCERPPAAVLRPHFYRTWIHRLPSEGAPPKAIVPDGYADLQWIDGALRIAGPDREAEIESIPAGATVIGLRFRPASIMNWLDVPAAQIVNARMPLEIFWGAAARDLADWVSEASSPEGVAQRLEMALAQRASITRAPDDLGSSIFRLLNTYRNPGACTAERLPEILGLSERTLRRRCREAFGYGPKTLDRILRFQRFFRLSRGAEPGRIAGLAAAVGYADQAHLTREARRLAGMTPATIVDQFSR